MKRALFFIVTLCIFIQPTFAADNLWSEGADINNDGIVDYKDFAIMANHWLVEDPNEPNAPDITWVYIDDDGSGMKDDSGNPISHGGFIGYMSKYETTNDQYCEFLNAALASGDIYVSDNIVYGSNGSNSGADFAGEVYFDTYVADSDSQITYLDSTFSVRIRDANDMSNHPVIEVSWYGATAFCNYYGFRLPTEWEWQAVADYDGSYTYGCGTTIDFSKANYLEGDYANPLGLTSYPYTSPVDHYLSYGYGMNDMAGNAWEWTSTVSGSYRVLRGGCWLDSGYDCTVSLWCTYYPGDSSFYVGFRVCR